MELLNCPFCGSNDLYQTEHRYYVEVYCDCGATNDSEKWNTRASQWVSVDKLIEEVIDHMNNGHKELASSWILNKLKELPTPPKEPE